MKRKQLKTEIKNSLEILTNSDYTSWPPNQDIYYPVVGFPFRTYHISNTLVFLYLKRFNCIYIYRLYNRANGISGYTKSRVFLSKYNTKLIIEKNNPTIYVLKHLDIFLKELIIEVI